MLSATLLAIVANLSWALGNLLNVKLSRTITPYQTVLWQNVLLLGMLFPLVITKPAPQNLAAVGFTAGLGVLLYLGSLAFYTALQRGSAQISGAIGATSPAFITLLSVLFLHASLSPLGLLLLGSITAGLITVSLPTRDTRLDVGIYYAIVAVLLWAIYFTFIAQSIKDFGPYWASYTSVIAGTAVLLVVGGTRSGSKADRLIIAKRQLPLVAASAVFVGGGPLVYNLALKLASPALVAPIAGSNSVPFIAAASVLFKDRLSPRQWAGVGLTVVSVICFAVVAG